MFIAWGNKDTPRSLLAYNQGRRVVIPSVEKKLLYQPDSLFFRWVFVHGTRVPRANMGYNLVSIRLRSTVDCRVTCPVGDVLIFGHIVGSLVRIEWRGSRCA